MDDFRVSSTSPLDAYLDREQSGARDRKRKRHTAEPSDEDHVSLSDQTENAGESVEDYYSPSEPNDDPE